MDNSDNELIDLLESLSPLRLLAPCCGKIPQNLPARTYCAYCDMGADWCQCDVSDFCDCGNS